MHGRVTDRAGRPVEGAEVIATGVTFRGRWSRGTAAISLEDGQLKLTLSAHPNFDATVTHWHYDTFLATWSYRLWRQSDVYFTLDGDGQVTKFRMAIRPDWIDTLEYEFVKND